MLRHDPQRVSPSEIPGSTPGCGSPRLIAACHVLRRLLAPRHPPCTLSSLTTMDRIPATSQGAPTMSLRIEHRFDWLVVDVVSLPLPSQLFTFQGASAGSRTIGFIPGSISRTNMVEVNGFEPSTSGLQSRRSPTELHPRIRQRPKPMWWAQVDSNYRPRPYQGRALTN